ncbi:hypothetical protein H0H92_014245 [Tricholoma furcatifolium]|nr:hypothetical protein H0H92_014245 [Tricholoma furcatifolium]
MPRSTSRTLLNTALGLAICVFTFFLLSTLAWNSVRPTQNQDVAHLDLAAHTTNPPRRQRVAVASVFSFHHDVYMTVAWSLGRAMNRSGSGSVEVYAKTPLGFAFQEVVHDLGLYRGEYRAPEELLPALRDDTDGNSFDLVVLGTCEIDLRLDWTKDLLSIWDERRDDRKFKLVCIVHNIKKELGLNHRQDTSWQSAITEWSRRGAIRLVAISEHPDPVLRTAGYENIPIDVHVPIIPLRNLPERPTSRPLSKAVIQGSFSMNRRDYANIFRELISSLHLQALTIVYAIVEDPSAWGYLPLGDQDSFVVDDRLSTPPFQLFTLGSGELEVPVELKNVVRVITGLTYPEFYHIMSDMDICVPAFAENGYFHDQASSTFAMAVQCNVPLLVTQRTRQSYRYADDDRAVVTRPAAMREVEALKALRLGDGSSFFDTPMPHMSTTLGSNELLRNAVKAMLHRGWKRTKDELDDFKVDIWRQNDDLAFRLLRDL